MPPSLLPPQELPPGPMAWHCLVLAYLKAEQPELALDATRRQYQGGVDIMNETFDALILAFAVRAAEGGHWVSSDGI